MKRLTIAVDCDDVIVPTAAVTLDYYNRTYGTAVALKDFYSNDLSLWSAPDDATAIRRFNEFMETDEFFDLVPTKDTIEALRELAAHHELHIVTGRPDFIEAATLAWLKRHLPDVFKTVVFTNYFTSNISSGKSLSKAEICQQIGVDYLIDDHLHHAEVTAAEGIRVLLFGNYPWNQATKLPPLVTRVKDWRHVKELLLPHETI